MVGGFSRQINQFVENRLEDIFTGTEYGLFMDSIYAELEDILSDFIRDLDEETKSNLIEDLKTNLFEQVLYQNKSTYRVAFKDAFSFFMSMSLKD